MAYSEELRERISALTEDVEHTQYKKMFGGVCHLVNGNMFGGVLGDELILRVGEEKAKALLEKEGVRLFDAAGKPMKNWRSGWSMGFLLHRVCRPKRRNNHAGKI